MRTHYTHIHTLHKNIYNNGIPVNIVRPLTIVGATGLNEQFYMGTTASLHCCFYAQPYCPTITWYKDGVKIKDESGDTLPLTKITNHGRTLKVYTTATAGGHYTCNAITPSGMLNHTMQVSIHDSKFHAMYST